jgi:major intracellular serine protease
MRMKRNKNKVSLLPYISEELNGYSTSSPQQNGWELDKFNIQSLWPKSQGENVIVAVIDTGCDLSHPDLKENLLSGKNFVDSSKPPQDDNGHGSHVSSTIAAINNGIGMVGLAPKTKILPVKALDDQGSGVMDNIINSIIYAADYGGVDFITMSLGSPNGIPRLEEAINYANSKGCVIFCAAGNSGENSEIMYPAKYEKTISIGAVDENLDRTSFTCSGESLDFLAPGHNILGCVQGGRYAIMSGTSMSNPFAVGCACLLLSHNKKHHKYSLNTYQDYIQVFKTTALELANERYRGKRKYQGYGVINPVGLL